MKAEYINHMGDDLTVVNAARVSFDKEADYTLDGGYFDVSVKDQKLINYLASHNHWTPFSHAMITMRETVPIFVARQRFKHMVGFTYNEVSRRYVDDEPEFFIPEVWRKRADNKKQGSSDEEINHETYSSIWDYHSIHDDLGAFYEEVLDFYESLLKNGVAPEQARMVLPQSMYTSYYCTGSLAAWARAYNLRSKPDSQAEIKDLADHWNEIIEPLFPHSWEALTNGT